MRKSKTYSAHVPIQKGTSIGRNPITSTMNKKKISLNKKNEKKAFLKKWIK